MPGLQSACAVCGPRPGVSPDSLSKCSRCQAVLYCGRAHQSEHFPEHKSICKRIKKNRATMEKEAEEVRNGPEDDWMTPANAFETGVGHFWGIHSTRPYMRAKLMVLRALSCIRSRPAIEAALTESMDCLRLCRGDNMGVREVIPTLMLLLGQYQEAYDFIKWYATSGQDSHYDWGDMDLPFLDVRNADMTEDLDEVSSNGSIFFGSSIVFIKMMLSKEVLDAINAHEVADRSSLPAVVTDSLRGYLVSAGNTKSLAELKELHTKLARQVRESFAMAHAQNKHFWAAMLDSKPLIEAPDAPYYSSGDIHEVQGWVEQNSLLWVDHLDFIRENLSK